MTDVDAIIVSYNSGELLRGQLACGPLRKAFGRIIVVDNASTDDSVAIADAANATVIARAENSGLATALNEGLRHSTADFVAVLNPDVLLDDDSAIESLFREFDAPDVGLVAPRLRLPDGALQDSARKVPTPSQLVARRLTGRSLGVLNPAQPSDVPWVVLAFVIIRRAALDDIGGFDEDFFLYFEDVDLCVRLWKAGWRVRLDTNSTAQHGFHGESRQSLKSRAARHHRRSARTFFAKHPRMIVGQFPFLGRPLRAREPKSLTASRTSTVR